MLCHIGFSTVKYCTATWRLTTKPSHCCSALMCRRRHEGSLPQQLRWQCHQEGSRRPTQQLQARTPSLQLKQFPPAMALPCQLASLMARPLWPTRLPVLLVRTASSHMQHLLACSIAVGHETVTKVLTHNPHILPRTHCFHLCRQPDGNVSHPGQSP
jgi:hypothetical protein